MKEWTIAKNPSLKKTIIPIKSSDEIPVAFSRTVDADIDSPESWGIKVNDAADDVG